jgi:hypothetical protein
LQKRECRLKFLALQIAVTSIGKLVVVKKLKKED